MHSLPSDVPDANQDVQAGWEHVLDSVCTNIEILHLLDVVVALVLAMYRL